MAFMGELLSPDLSIPLDNNVSEWLLGTSAVLLHHQGERVSATLLTQVQFLEVTLWDTEFGREGYKITLVVEPHLYPDFGTTEMDTIADAMRTVLSPSGKSIDILNVRPELTRLGTDWRQHLNTANGNGPAPANQGRKARLAAEDQHPVKDDLHFTNEWEYGLYEVLKERQAALPDNDTIGIMPLAGIRLLGRTREPDFVITYKGRAGVIEVDGPHHAGPRRASNDHSRDALMYNAGIRWVARLDVRDVKARAEVEKFVDNFLARLIA
ncbi:hypothetical protein C0Q95_21155 [Streptomyces albidoflavus]|nr:hypothetical protein C0Q95_21155 [Streptomyces albidoflavus]